MAPRGDSRSELAELSRLMGAHLRHELELGVDGLPRVAAPRPVAEPSDAEAPGRATAAQAMAAETMAAETTAAVAPAAAEPAPVEALAHEEPADRDALLAVVRAEAAACTKCGLAKGRTKSVFSRGSSKALVAFVGEGPGYNEDQTGEPFVGKAGQLLDKMIRAMGLSADEIYICNVVKCRPPDNRTPSPDEAGACLPYLERQLAIVQPEVIVALGRCAAENLGVGGSGWRGRWGTYLGRRVMPTYHPAYLLRSPEQKRPVWEDLQKVVAALARELPTR